MTDKLIITPYRKDKRACAPRVIRIDDEAANALYELQYKTGYSTTMLASLLINYAVEHTEVSDKEQE